MIIDVHAHAWQYPDHFNDDFRRQGARAKAGMELDLTIRYEDYRAAACEEVRTIVFTGNATNFSVSQYGNGLGGQTQVNDGNWHFLAVTATPNGGSNADYLIYVDGLLDGTGTYGGPKTMQTNTSVPGTNDSFFLGTDIFSDQYNGLLAQVAIFNTALNAQQIADLYLAAQTPPPAPEPSSLLLASLGMFLVVRHRRQR